MRAKAFFGHGVLSLLAFFLLIAPNFVLTVIAGLTTDPFALSVVVALPLAITVKEAHLPERLAPSGTLTSRRTRALTPSTWLST